MNQDFITFLKLISPGYGGASVDIAYDESGKEITIPDASPLGFFVNGHKYGYGFEDHKIKGHSMKMARGLYITGLKNGCLRLPVSRYIDGGERALRKAIRVIYRDAIERGIFNTKEIQP